MESRRSIVDAASPRSSMRARYSSMCGRVASSTSSVVVRGPLEEAAEIVAVGVQRPAAVASQERHRRQLRVVDLGRRPGAATVVVMDSIVVMTGPPCRGDPSQLCPLSRRSGAVGARTNIVERFADYATPSGCLGLSSIAPATALRTPLRMLRWRGRPASRGGP